MPAGQDAGGAGGFAGSCASRDLPDAFRGAPAAAGTHRTRRTARQVCDGLGEPLRLPPGEGRRCGESRAARGEERGGRDALRSPPPSLPRRPGALGARRGSPLPGAPGPGAAQGRGCGAQTASAAGGACAPGCEKSC